MCGLIVLREVSREGADAPRSLGNLVSPCGGRNIKIRFSEERVASAV